MFPRFSQESFLVSPHLLPPSFLHCFLLGRLQGYLSLIKAADTNGTSCSFRRLLHLCSESLQHISPFTEYTQGQGKPCDQAHISCFIPFSATVVTTTNLKLAATPFMISRFCKSQVQTQQDLCFECHKILINLCCFPRASQS